eukprot:GFYU01015016.1.p1 GENE.GFYU01015016.1~~GFYU01015016.1.p1  ORF type:complete len:514 (+),score=120.04 GFYU01015016.1:24-1565(+)
MWKAIVAVALVAQCCSVLGLAEPPVADASTHFNLQELLTGSEGLQHYLEEAEHVVSRLTEQFQSLKPVSQNAPKVAVVGGGIGGGATSYYLKKLLPNAEITVYEKTERIGGRLYHIDYQGLLVEVGGDAWAVDNYYMQTLTKDLKIKLSGDDDSTVDSLSSGPRRFGGVQIYDGTKFVPINVTLKEKLLMGAIVLIFRERLLRNYWLRGSKPFSKVEDFLLHGSLNKYTSVSTLEFFKKNYVPIDLAQVSVEPILRAIYDQSMEVSTFASLVSLLAASAKQSSAAAGNSEVVRAMLTAGGADVRLNTHVTDVKKSDGADGKYTVTSTTTGADGAKDQSEEYDVVVVATPLEFSDLQSKFPQVALRDFVHIYVTFVEADDINLSYFDPSTTPSSTSPDDILTTESSGNLFTELSYRGQSKSGKRVYKMFTNEDITGRLSELFVNHSNPYVHHWPHTFPNLNPSAQSSYQDVHLDSHRMFYINGMESVASAMEGSVIGARNIALLVADQEVNGVQ